MKKLHIALAAVCAVCASAGIATASELAPLISCALLLAAAALQIPAFPLWKRKSLIFRCSIGIVAMAALIASAALCGLTLIGFHAAVYIFSITLAIGAALLIPAKEAEIADPDPTGERFTALLNEALETISRATAERQCGYDTQLLYEKARFCEPCASVSVRAAEQEILERILTLNPRDSDAETSAKCAAISALIDKREIAADKAEKSPLRLK